ncbi:hypothetical protein M422DRAFT_68166 [Sphaerobolus stellatus SS14]|uniref:Uncharacterized protein n=1 Tax=Sphaerobolus stellatus (strain SS14) TaxID=990650 RepID=A0A0C9V4B4_SPHS4|nr:hypothetical protein M422DRAFT_68166 [Sphaerobolus stellatus SS14]
MVSRTHIRTTLTVQAASRDEGKALAIRWLLQTPTDPEEVICALNVALDIDWSAIRDNPFTLSDTEWTTELVKNWVGRMGNPGYDILCGRVALHIAPQEWKSIIKHIGAPADLGDVSATSIHVLYHLKTADCATKLDLSSLNVHIREPSRILPFIADASRWREGTTLTMMDVLERLTQWIASKFPSIIELPMWREGLKIIRILAEETSENHYRLHPDYFSLVQRCLEDGDEFVVSKGVLCLAELWGIQLSYIDLYLGSESDIIEHLIPSISSSAPRNPVWLSDMEPSEVLSLLKAFGSIHTWPFCPTSVYNNLRRLHCIARVALLGLDYTSQNDVEHVTHNLELAGRPSGETRQSSWPPQKLANILHITKKSELALDQHQYANIVLNEWNGVIPDEILNLGNFCLPGNSALGDILLFLGYDLSSQPDIHIIIPLLEDPDKEVAYAALRLLTRLRETVGQLTHYGTQVQLSSYILELVTAGVSTQPLDDRNGYGSSFSWLSTDEIPAICYLKLLATLSASETWRTLIIKDGHFVKALEITEYLAKVDNDSCLTAVLTGQHLAHISKHILREPNSQSSESLNHIGRIIFCLKICCYIHQDQAWKREDWVQSHRLIPHEWKKAWLTELNEVLIALYEVVNQSVVNATEIAPLERLYAIVQPTIQLITSIGTVLSNLTNNSQLYFILSE